MRVRISTLVLGMILLLTAGCNDAGRQTADFLWPELNNPYFRSVKDWTRHDVVYDGISAKLELTATLFSTPLVEEYSTHYSRIFGLTADEEELFTADQMRSLKSSVTIFLSVSTPGGRSPKLSLENSSINIFALQGENKLYPIEIKALDRRTWPASRLKEFFPFYKRWQTYYTVRFEPFGTEPLRLVATGPSGHVEFYWERFE